MYTNFLISKYLLRLSFAKVLDLLVIKINKSNKVNKKLNWILLNNIKIKIRNFLSNSYVLKHINIVTEIRYVYGLLELFSTG